MAAQTFRLAKIENVLSIIDMLEKSANESLSKLNSDVENGIESRDESASIRGFYTGSSHSLSQVRNYIEHEFGLKLSDGK